MWHSQRGHQWHRRFLSWNCIAIAYIYRQLGTSIAANTIASRRGTLDSYAAGPRLHALRCAEIRCISIRCSAPGCVPRQHFVGTFPPRSAVAIASFSPRHHCQRCQQSTQHQIYRKSLRFGAFSTAFDHWGSRLQSIHQLAKLPILPTPPFTAFVGPRFVASNATQDQVRAAPDTKKIHCHRGNQDSSLRRTNSQSRSGHASEGHQDLSQRGSDNEIETLGGLTAGLVQPMFYSDSPQAHGAKNNQIDDFLVGNYKIFCPSSSSSSPPLACVCVCVCVVRFGTVKATETLLALYPLTYPLSFPVL